MRHDAMIQPLVYLGKSNNSSHDSRWGFNHKQATTNLDNLYFKNENMHKDKTRKYGINEQGSVIYIYNAADFTMRQERGFI